MNWAGVNYLPTTGRQTGTTGSCTIWFPSVRPIYLAMVPLVATGTQQPCANYKIGTRHVTLWYSVSTSNVERRLTLPTPSSNQRWLFPSWHKASFHLWSWTPPIYILNLNVTGSWTKQRPSITTRRPNRLVFDHEKRNSTAALWLCGLMNQFLMPQILTRTKVLFYNLTTRNSNIVCSGTTLDELSLI